MTKTFKCILIIAASFISVNAQSLRGLNNDGVDLYNKKKFQDAEVNFKKGIEKDSNSFYPHYNLGDSYYKQGKFDEAMKSFEKSASKSLGKEDKSKAFYNMGNTFVKQEKYKEAIESFKKSLKLNPKDKDAKYNLSYAIQKLKDQQNNQNKNNQNKNDKNKDNKDNKKDQNKDNKNNNDKNKDQNKDNKDQNKDKNKNDDNKNQNNKGQQPKPDQSKMTKPEAERILDAIKNNEKDLQKQLRKKAGAPVKTDKDW
jgi:tetratricopeptide (TPR) repeat protein